jgi:hypothetical protein
MAESIGWSPEFVTEEEPLEPHEGHQRRSEGMMVAGMLCMCATVTAVVAGTSYFVLATVA